MNILITGANGFIGRNVCKYLKEKKNYLVAIDLHSEQKCLCDEYVKCDLSTPQVDNLFSNIKVDKIDAVVHLASDMRKEPFNIEVVQHNCVSMQRLLEFAEKNQVGSFVELSSLPVIGSPVQHPITEEHPLNPPTVYHATKIAQEFFAEYAYTHHNLRTVSLRICAPVGEGVNPKTIFPTFIRKAVNNEDLILVGKGGRKQTYIHVSDIAQAIYKSINSEAQGVYNLGSYNLISNLELAKKCIKLTNSKSKILFIDRVDPEENRVWDVCIDKLKRDTGYEPVVNINEAILELANIYRKDSEV